MNSEVSLNNEVNKG